ncbi:MAG: hypothetical protein WCK65_10425 [Rhodospirillaceae bacterium]
MNKPTLAGLVARTLSERGIAVPFTTPALAQARMRRDTSSKRLEFVLPSLSGSKGFYVMPWKSITETLTTTLHDRILYDLMLQQNVDDPIKMRCATLEVAARGLAGPRAAQKAEEIIDSEKQYQVLTNFLLVMQLLKLVNVSSAKLISDGLASESSKNSLRAALIDVADRLRVTHNDLYSRVEALSAMIAPIGVPQAPEPGRLRALADELMLYRDTVSQWSMVMPGEIAQLGAFQAEIAGLTNVIATNTVGRIDTDTEALAVMLKTWEKKSLKLDIEIKQLAWLLDGWDFLIAAFRDANEKGNEERQAMITNTFPLLPIIPTDHLECVSENNIQALGVLRGRWVRKNEDWRSGVLDLDQVRRLENSKALMQ